MAEFAVELERWLGEVANGSDGTRIRTATTTLKSKFYGDAMCIPALVQIVMRDRADAATRYMAAIELRKRTANKKLWSRLSASDRATVKTLLLQYVLAAHNEKQLCVAMCRVIAVIARAELTTGHWNELLPMVYACCQDTANPMHRQLGYFLLVCLLETVPDALRLHLGPLFQLYAHGLKDPDSLHVKVYTMEGLAKLADLIEPDDHHAVTGFRQLLPDMITVIQLLIEHQDHDKALAAIEVIIDLLTSEHPILSKHMPQCVEFFIAIAANRSIDENVRNQALTFLMFAAVYKKNAILRAKLITPMVHHLMTIGTEPEPDDMDDDSAARTAFRVINTMAMNLAPQHVFPPVWDTLTAFASNVASAGHRKAAMMGLASVSEGCSDYIRCEFKLANLLPVVMKALQDPDLTVRRAACVALAALSSDMGSELSEFHGELLPLVFGQLNDQNERIRKAALETLDTLLEHLGANIKPYLNTLMEQLVRLLDESDMDIQMTLVGAIGSAAHAAGTEFQPYFDAVMTRLAQFMSLTDQDDEDQMALRGSATDAISTIALAVGAHAFAPHLTQFMEMAMQGIDMGTNHLAESGHYFFGSMAKLYKADFGQFLGPVVQKLFQSCQLEEKDLDALAAEGDEGEDFGVAGADEDDEQAYLSGYTINNAIAEEKEMAVDTLGVLFENTQSQFMPYLTKTLELVQELCDHSHENVRRGCISALFRFLTAMVDMHHPELKWEPTMSAPGYALHPDVAEMGRITVGECLKMLDDEDEKSVVCAIVSELAEALKKVGPVLILGQGQKGCLEAVVHQVLLVLSRQHPCQAELDQAAMDGQQQQQPDEEDEDQAEFDALLVSDTVDLVGVLALVFGPEFAQYLKIFWPHIAKNFKPTKPVSDRSMVMGVIGELAGGLKTQITPFTAEMLQMTLLGLQDEDEEVKSNAAFSVGVLCANSAADTQLGQEYPVILQTLGVLFHPRQPYKTPNVLDNAISAVCRMISKRPGAVPLGQVLPTILQALPIKHDHVENKAVLSCFETLFLSNYKSEVTREMKGRLGEVLVEMLSGSVGEVRERTCADEEVRERMVRMVKQLGSEGCLGKPEHVAFVQALQ